MPILDLALKGQGLSEQELFDFGANFVRNQLATVPGAAIPWPYGGKQREVAVNVDIPALQAKGLSPVDVINAISSQNLALPAGTVKLGSTEYNVQMNGSTDTIAALNDLPIKTANGATIYVRDVAHVSDGFSPQTNIVRMDGQRGVLVTDLQKRQRAPRSISSSRPMQSFRRWPLPCRRNWSSRPSSTSRFSCGRRCRA